MDTESPCESIRQRGQDLVEYALLLSLVALVVVASILAFGTYAANMWGDVVTGIVGILSL